jgi:hypothetical protein
VAGAILDLARSRGGAAAPSAAGAAVAVS